MIGAVGTDVEVDAAEVMAGLDAAVSEALEVWNAEEAVAGSTARTRKAAVRDFARWLFETGGPSWDSPEALGSLAGWVAAHQDTLSSSALNRRRRDIRLFCEFLADLRDLGEGSLFGGDVDDGSAPDDAAAAAGDDAVVAEAVPTPVEASADGEEPDDSDPDEGVVVWAEDHDDDGSGGAGGVSVELERVEARSTTVRAALEELVARKRSRERGARPVELS